MTETTRTQISSLGKVAFLEELLEPFKAPSIGPATDFTAPEPTALLSDLDDDSAVIDRGHYLELVACDTMLEGIDFDLHYTALEYLGRKAVVAGISNVLAMNGVPRYISVSIGLSARFCVEDARELYNGIRRACNEFDVKLIGGNTSSSITGLTIATTTLGEVTRDRLTRRSGAQVTDLVCLSGSLGASLLGLHILEREKRATQGHPELKSLLDPKYGYLFSRLLRPDPRIDIIQALALAGITPTSMIDITQGLSSAAMHLCASSGVGMRIHLDRLPINAQVFDTAEELGIDPVVAALNGGDDFELLITIPLALHKEIPQIHGLDIIGHITNQNLGAALITPDGAQITLQSPDWTAQETKSAL